MLDKNTSNRTEWGQNWVVIHIAYLSSWWQRHNCSGGSRGGAQGASPRSFLDQTEAQRAKKIFLRPSTPPPPRPFYLTVWMTPPPPPLSQGLDPPLNCNLILITLKVCLTKGQWRSLYPCLVLIILQGQCFTSLRRAGTRQTVPFIFYLRWSQDCLNPITFMEHYVTVT